MIRVSQSGTEGGGYGAAHIDSHNMDFDRLVSNAGGYMPAMQSMQRVKNRHSHAMALRKNAFAQKNKAPLEGESGAEDADECDCMEGTIRRRQEEGEALDCCQAGI